MSGRNASGPRRPSGVAEGVRDGATVGVKLGVRVGVGTVGVAVEAVGGEVGISTTTGGGAGATQAARI